MDQFAPSRTAALERLSQFLPKAGKTYTAGRNYDYGPGRHDTAVSTLSPYLRHRLMTEEEVLDAVLGKHALSSAEKFVQEVFWRTYWKGWLQMRPSIWHGYRADLKARLDDVATQGGLRREWESACTGETGIDAFDHWAHELVDTGYLHNHARMWFASIWIFTLRLPWELGADFFLRHLLDGDPASNTLSWRWVAGLQTKGKTYLARPDNIAKYTERRFRPRDLSSVAVPLRGPDHPPRLPAPAFQPWDANRPSALLLSTEDLSPGWLFEAGLRVAHTALWSDADHLSPLQTAPRVAAFKRGALEDASGRWRDRLGTCTSVDNLDAMVAWAAQTGADQIVTPFAPVGPTANLLDTLADRLHAQDQQLVTPLRSYDAMCWPHATHGFFRFKEKIPKMVAELKGLKAA
ncbi:FAD-binding domain-containing protein [Primorskyibacter sp. S187A]|uniref:FAD-binding domain-containing protein n=1 Tax=Primorskyibacter sp. S187A TaxID=3415130 RepID=UPI003C7DBD2A